MDKVVYWLNVCAVVAEMMANEYLSDRVGTAFERYLDRGVLMADVHFGNVGCRRAPDGNIDVSPIITDPGHVIVFKRALENIKVPVL